MQEVSKFSLHRKERWEDIISQEEDNETNNTLHEGCRLIRLKTITFDLDFILIVESDLFM